MRPLLEYEMIRLLALLSVALVAVTADRPIAAAESDPDVAASWEFKDGTAGWKVMSQCELATDQDRLVIRSLGGDPHFVTDVSAPAGWKLLRLRARFRGRLNWQLFWGEDGKDGFSEQRSVRSDVRGNAEQFRLVDLYFRPEADLTSIRLDPGNRKARIEVASIALLNQAPPPPQATPVDLIRMAKGFEVELLYSVPDEQGSWVSMTADPEGRLITSDQYGKLYRVTPPGIGDAKSVKVEPIPLEIGMAHGMCWAFDSLYVSVNEKNAGLYRVRDTDGDDQLDEVKKLRAYQGGGEHGPHAVIPGPDGKSLYVCGGNHSEIPNPETSRVPRNWAEDQLLPRMWDAGGHAVGKLAPGGWIAKTDPEGKHFELICIGFRNEYDIAFNQDGELFTYDADMEWDIGTSWYRPTRINHVTSGAEFGWRSGTGKWPEYYPDSLGSVVDIGPGSPTGIVFGTGAKFPAKYQRALFVCDWSYGVLYAVHMKAKGASYVGEAERFASGTPLQLTDIIINPTDGAMYFTIGGRRTQSGLYRVTYTGDESTDSAKDWPQPGHAERTLRSVLEALHGPGNGDQIPLIWKHLSHKDRHIRYAARIALEHIPVDHWEADAIAEQNPIAAISAAIALARNGASTIQQGLLRKLNSIATARLPEEHQLGLLRAYGLTLARFGPPDAQTRRDILAGLDGLFPANSEALNRELAQLLIYLEAPGVADRTVALLDAAPTQEEQLHYGLALRSLKSGWTQETHKAYFNWFLRAAAHRGGHSFGGFLKNIRNEAIARLSDTDREQLKELLAREPNPADVPVVEPREVVKRWTVAELLPSLQTHKTGRNFERGRKMFAQGACFKCHRFAGQGGTVGPDLTGAGQRFNDLNMLESLIEPSKAVSDQYQATSFLLESGRTVSGRIVNLSGPHYLVSENMLEPGRLTPVNRNEIDQMVPSKVSMMPRGLVDTLTEEEILDLIAYIRSGGNPKHEAFQ